ncbi:transposase [Dubosiella newyorkensis]|uniref:transposase n=1 Tax=Dubosiella newyorkensis TaxID=1862672 RepID=UPI003F67FCC2
MEWGYRRNVPSYLNIQRCMVHSNRNIVSSWRVKRSVANHRRISKGSIRPNTRKRQKEKLQEFLDKWGAKYPKIKVMLGRKKRTCLPFY